MPKCIDCELDRANAQAHARVYICRHKRTHACLIANTGAYMHSAFPPSCMSIPPPQHPCPFFANSSLPLAQLLTCNRTYLTLTGIPRIVHCSLATAMKTTILPCGARDQHQRDCKACKPPSTQASYSPYDVGKHCGNLAQPASRELYSMQSDSAFLANDIHGRWHAHQLGR